MRIRSAGSIFWSRNTSTEYCRNALWISSQTFSSRKSTSETPRTSAPERSGERFDYHPASYMPKRIAIVGAGALGGYVGGTLAHLGHDVTLIDPWPEHVETIRTRGLELDGLTPEEQFTVKPKIMHLTEVQALAKTPVDVAMVAVKSYDTLWATALIAPYLSEQGFVVSLQNCMNEETIAGVVGWGRTVGAVASMISVDLYEAGRIRRTVAKGGDKHTIFRIGEPHGRITPRVEELVEVVQRHRQREGHDQPVGRALVEAGAERHGQRRYRGDRPDLARLPAQRRGSAASRSRSPARPSASARRSATRSRRCAASSPRSSRAPRKATPRRWPKSRAR